MLGYYGNFSRAAITNYENKQPYIIILIPLIHIFFMVLLGPVIILSVVLHIIRSNAKAYNPKRTPDQPLYRLFTYTDALLSFIPKKTNLWRFRFLPKRPTPNIPNRCITDVTEGEWDTYKIEIQANIAEKVGWNKHRRRWL